MKKTKTQPAPAPAKARRLEEICESKKGLFAIDPTLLSVEPGFNKRTNYGNLNQLADDIAANGLDQPIKIRKLPGTEIIYIVSGHRRLRAITEILIPKGRWQDAKGKTKTVDCYAEAQGTTKVDRLISQIAGNTGLAYSLLEKAEVYKEILAEDPKIKPADLSRRFGESKQAVSDALRLINDGCPALLDAINKSTLAASTAIAIIKQAGTDHEAQLALFLAAQQAAGSDHITPKHIPEPDPLELVRILYHKRESNAGLLFIGRRKDGIQILAERFIETGFPENNSAKLNIGWSWGEDGIWQVGYYFSKGSGERQRENYALCMDGKGGEKAARHEDLRSALIGVITLAANFHGWESKTHAAFESAALGLLKDKDFRNPKMAEKKSETPDPKESGSEEDQQSSIDNHQSSISPSFTLYQIEDAPADLIPGTTTRHETDRLVLTNAPDTIGLLHLLVAPTPNGLLSFGYRLNETEYLPDASGHLGTNIVLGLRHSLDTALEGYDLHPDDTDAIADALFTALAEYYPEEGEAKQPETLAFTPPGQEPEDGYKRILNAPSTNRDGSAPGKGEGGFSAPDKQMEKLEKILDDLDKKDKGDPARISTTELILGFIRNERSSLTIREHLQGK